MKPNQPLFIGIGGHRCATTWLFKNLVKLNNLVCLSKETHFFSRHFDYGYQWYFNQICNNKFDKPICEFSTSYLYSHEAPERIKNKFPNTKIILILRNPINRAYSHYRHEIYNKRNINIDINISLSENPSFLFLSDYYKYLSRWLEIYKLDEMKILIFEDIISDDVNTFNNIQKYLGLSKVNKNSLIKKNINYSLIPKNTNSSNLYNLIKGIYIDNPLIKIITPNFIINYLKKSVENKLLTKNVDEDKNNIELIRSKYYENKKNLEHIDKLSKLLNLNLRKKWFDE